MDDALHINDSYGDHARFTSSPDRLYIEFHSEETECDMAYDAAAVRAIYDFLGAHLARVGS